MPPLAEKHQTSMTSIYSLMAGYDVWLNAGRNAVTNASVWITDIDRPTGHTIIIRIVSLALDVFDILLTLTEKPATYCEHRIAGNASLRIEMIVLPLTAVSRSCERRRLWEQKARTKSLLELARENPLTKPRKPKLRKPKFQRLVERLLRTSDLQRYRRQDMASKAPITEDGRHPYHKPPETTVFQKLMIILAFITVTVLCALTASLPINLPRDQRAMDIGSPPADTIDNGDTAWMIIATIFVVLLGPVVAYFYG